MNNLLLKSPKNKIYALNLTGIHKTRSMDYEPKRTLVNTADTIEIIEKSEIVRIESSQNFMKLYLTQGTILLSTDPLNSLVQKLGDSFCCSHKSHLVNLIHISRLHRDGSIEMDNGDLVPVARRRKKEFMQALEAWMGD